MIVLSMLVLAFALAFVRHKMGVRSKGKDMKFNALAGYDTGTRFARRVPGAKWLRPTRGF